MFVDPHTHHHLSNYATLELLSAEGVEAVAILAYIPVKPSSHKTLLDLFNWLVNVEPERFRSVGIKAYVGLGIHPRNVPDEGLSELMDSLELWLSRADLVGEVGLEVSSEVEVELLSKILKISSKLDKLVIIHTPRKGKELIVRKLSEVLRNSPVNPDKVVVDHASRDLINEFLGLDTYIGLTVQQGKLSIADLIDAVSKYPELVDKGLVNSDCGRDPSDPLTVKKAYYALVASGLNHFDAIKLTRDNALKVLR